ncbi:hypothetical protein ACLOJK_023788 [Asimina triloba]
MSACWVTMEVHSAVASGIGRRLWNFVRIAFFMIRKGILSKRKLLMDMNLMMKSRKVLVKPTLRNLVFHTSKGAVTPRYGLNEYEFSCSNSPNPIFFHAAKRKHHPFSLKKPHFPCINIQDERDDQSDHEARLPVIMLPKIEYSPAAYSNDSRLDGSELSPLVSPFSIRVSNCSWDDENENGGRQVDAEAEEFIKRFYEQLRVQSRTALLEYQENEYQEMLDRGTS